MATRRDLCERFPDWVLQYEWRRRRVEECQAAAEADNCWDNIDRLIDARRALRLCLESMPGDLYLEFAPENEAVLGGGGLDPVYGPPAIAPPEIDIGDPEDPMQRTATVTGDGSVPILDDPESFDLEKFKPKPPPPSPEPLPAPSLPAEAKPF